MSDKEKVQGPASYFPSIEKKYGFPINYWLDALKTQKELKHMEMVAWLSSLGYLSQVEFAERAA